MLASLPKDVLPLISDFSGSRILSYTCRHTWDALQRRHACYCITAENVLKIIAALGHSPTIPLHHVTFLIRRIKTLENHLPTLFQADSLCILTITLTEEENEDENAERVNLAPFVAFQHARSVHTLRLNLSSNRLGPPAARSLARLSASGSLCKLYLELRDNYLRDTGVTSLVALKEAQGLHTLVLNLEKNAIGDTGTAALAGLKDAPNLSELTMLLGGNRIGNTGAAALAGLKDSPSLHSLHLDLKDNLVGGTGATALLAPKDARYLHSLTLELASNQIGNTSDLAQTSDPALATPSLLVLQLNLRSIQMGSYRASSLALTLKNSLSFIHTLGLDLNLNHVGVSGASDIALALEGAPCLHTLRLQLMSNGLGDSGAAALAVLKNAPSLHTLWLRLQCNRISEVGVSALVGLQESRTLRSLFLFLNRNELCDSAFAALARLRDADFLLTLGLSLSQGMGEKQMSPAVHRTLKAHLLTSPVLQNLLMAPFHSAEGTEGDR
jgi:hypothetical protein